MIRVYLAARYSRREELCRYADDLRALGIEVTSRWLAGNHQIDDAGLSVEAKSAERTRFATEDYADVMAADWCISFTETPRSSNSRGGRHVEFGAALASGLRVVVIGPRENVFHCLPDVEVYPGWAEFVEKTRPEMARGLWPSREDLDAVRSVRRRWDAGGVTQTEMAAEYGVAGCTVHAIIARRNWSHVQ